MKAREIVDFIESIASSGSGAGNETNHFLLGDAGMAITTVLTSLCATISCPTTQRVG